MTSVKRRLFGILIMLLALATIGCGQSSVGGASTTSAAATPTFNALTPTVPVTVPPVATATATPPPSTPTPVSTVPGPTTFADPLPSCDNLGNWSPTTNEGSVSCHAAVVTLEQNAGATNQMELFFNGAGSGFAFSANYNVSVQISNIAGSSCAGVIVLGNQLQGVGAYLCANNSWVVYQYDTSGGAQTLASGSVSTAGSSSLDIQVSSASVRVIADGNVLASVTSSGTTTTYLALAVYNYQPGGNVAAFGDFAAFQYGSQ